MNKFFLTFIFVLSLLYFAEASESVKIGVITDVHFLSEKLVDEGAAYQLYKTNSGRNIRELHSVLDVVLKDFELKNIDVLLILGDMSNHGERESHIDFIEKIKPLQQKGTRVFVIPGNHDINVPDSKKYIGDKPQPTENISVDEFVQLYASFGYADALKRDTASLSYLVEMNEKTWLLSFDTNRYKEYTTTSLSGGRVLPQTMEWALNILQEAKAKDISVLGMMHHGVVEHLPYQAMLFPNHLVDNREWVAETLADAGMKVIFTGHFHANDITLQTTPSGNTIFDVETGSLSQYPFVYRLMKLEGDSLAIDTYFVESIPGVPDLQSKYRAKMEDFVKRSVAARLQHESLPIPLEIRDLLINLAAQINVLHAKGDETLNDEMMLALKQFSEAMGSEEFDAEAFELDFPPEDNKLVINLKK